jgi:hypothetical protein
VYLWTGWEDSDPNETDVHTSFCPFPGLSAAYHLLIALVFAAPTSSFIPLITHHSL